VVKRIIAIVVLALSSGACLDSNSTKGVGISKSIEVPSLNISLFQKINFANEVECREFVTKNSGNKIKSNVGGFLCVMQFGNSSFISTSESRNLSKCILEDFKNIIDDSSGTRIVTRCNEKFQLKEVGFMIIDEFSESKRIERVNESNRLQRELENRTNQILERSRNDGPFILNDGDTRKSCFKMGSIINCD
jgi:hypothetical protein